MNGSKQLRLTWQNKNELARNLNYTVCSQPPVRFDGSAEAPMLISFKTIEGVSPQGLLNKEQGSGTPRKDRTCPPLVRTYTGFGHATHESTLYPVDHPIGTSIIKEVLLT